MKIALRNICICIGVVSVLSAGCNIDKSLKSDRYKKIRTSFYTEKDSVTGSTNWVCFYSCNRNIPWVIDEEYFQTLKIRFNKMPERGKTYSLPDSNVYVSGTFNSVWVWDKTYENAKIKGTVSVLFFNKKNRITLHLNLREKYSDSADEVGILNRIQKFRGSLNKNR